MNMSVRAVLAEGGVCVSTMLRSPSNTPARTKDVEQVGAQIGLFEKNKSQ